MTASLPPCLKMSGRDAHDGHTAVFRPLPILEYLRPCLRASFFALRGPCRRRLLQSQLISVKIGITQVNKEGTNGCDDVSGDVFSVWG